ncbi:MAG: hypothetical protein Q9173_006772, partial [Seirophora scorigena]
SPSSSVRLSNFYFDLKLGSARLVIGQVTKYVIVTSIDRTTSVDSTELPPVQSRRRKSKNALRLGMSPIGRRHHYWE